MRNVKTSALLAIAAGTCAAVGMANAQTVINISGATLLENYVKAPASTNDFIDCDNDGVAGSLGSLSIDQLAPTTPGVSDWVVQYRSVGSVNGFNELTRFGDPTCATGDHNNAAGILGQPTTSGGTPSGVASAAYMNRTLYINGGLAVGAYDSTNPGGAPFTSAGDVICIDIAPLDVATKWATRKVGGTSNWDKTPLAVGYGTNPVISVNKTGGASGAGLSNQLVDLNGRNHFDPSNPGLADSNTIFDNELAFAPIAPVVNFGTGITQVKMSELQHLFSTGRAITGENLITHTRDVGSGTRNAFMNSIGVDPSFGRGENIGSIITSSSQSLVGPNFFPSNKGSNGRMEETIRNTRLGIGYVGTERGVTGSGSGSWLSSGALEIADTMGDIYGQTTYIRPTTSKLVHNTIGDATHGDGWLIGGQAVLATIGDPLAESIADGGLGASTPQMANPAAACYMNNIRQSIAAFISVPTDPENFGMPGEFAATQFFLISALDNLHDQVSPTTMVTNTGFASGVQAYTLANNIHNNAAFNSFNTSSAGRVPTRTTGVTYTDGVVGGGNYLSQGGANVAYGAVLTLRNKIAGDFNGNGARDAGDIAEMLKAFRQRNAGPAWVAPAGSGPLAGQPGTDAIIEVLGDHNADGNFDAADVRYAADGLYLVGGNLDRKAGFTAVDTEWNTLTGSSNFFATTKATSAPYAAGDARGDIAKASGEVARGWAPVGFDGVINAFDIDYVYAQFKKNANILDGAANWSNLDEAIHFDLSADINGDLVVDQADVCELVTGILGTSLGDVNLDGTVDGLDIGIINSNLGNAGTWATGDVSGDGQVTSDDLDIATGVTDPCLVCVADVDDGTGTGTPDGGVTIDDLLYYLNIFNLGSIAADVDDGSGTGTTDGGVTIDDLLYYLARFNAGC
ncbi:MAG: GC-type dockerin domain-anchored protein [Phycisphaerales bacterium]